MDYVVERAGTTLVTLREGTDTTARDTAVGDLQASLRALTDDVEWSITGSSIYEQPTAPFDPYTVSVAFEVAVGVEAATREEAIERGETIVDEALANAGVDHVTYASSAAASDG